MLVTNDNIAVKRGHAATETIRLIECASILAERSGNLTQRVAWLIPQGNAAMMPGKLREASTLADEVLELALREGSPIRPAPLYTLLIVTHYYRGKLEEAEKHFAVGLKVLEDSSLRTLPGFPVAALGTASWRGCWARPLAPANSRCK